MKTVRFTWFIWVPRIFSLVFVLFFGLFALDVFESDASWWQQVGGFIIHQVPSVLLLLMLIVTWKHPFWTGIIFILLAIVFTVFFRTYDSFLSFLMISIPVFLAAVLFIIASFKRKEQEYLKPVNPGNSTS